jgi:hypothetical protein
VAAKGQFRSAPRPLRALLLPPSRALDLDRVSVEATGRVAFANDDERNAQSRNPESMTEVTKPAGARAALPVRVQILAVETSCELSGGCPFGPGCER